MPADPNPKKEQKPGGAPEAEDAATVEPRPNPKKHPEDKNKKGKGKDDGKETPKRHKRRQEEDPAQVLRKGRAHKRKRMSIQPQESMFSAAR